MSAPAHAEIATERLILRPSAAKPGFAFVRHAEFHGRTVELYAVEV